MDGGKLGEPQLSRLLDVGRGLVSQLDLESVLREVLEAARELTGARYAALGILSEDKRELERFLYVGIDEATRRAIGPPPRGRGILGELIRDPRPLRLREVSDHPRSYGFPSGHPPMHSFLGVPIVIRGEAFGNLYLTDTRHGEFGDPDEQSVVVLAEWASIAIDNARLYERVEGRRDELERAVRGLEATTAIARAVGAETDLDRVVQLIVKRARALVEARSAAILLLRGDDLYVAATAGELEQPPDSVRVPSEGTVFGEVLRSGDSESLADLSSRVRFGPNELRGSASTALLVPLLFRGRTQGVLMALDSLENGDPRFDSDAEYLLESFAAAAANAIATARSVEADRLRHSMHASEQERKRWARELHDETLQELGALRFTLTGALQSHDPERVKGALERAVDQIGLTIGGLQGLITELRPAALDELGLRPAIEALAERIRTTSGLEVELDIGLRGGGGAAPSRLAPAIENTAYRLVQEALNNTVKHARAERVDIAILEDEASLTITVHDDGTGFRVDGAHSGFGLLGMHERAELVGGEVSIESTLGEGTTVSATLPARHAADRAGPATQTG
jgi:two-component system, NarL family, sensor histidine kinase DevS